MKFDIVRAWKDEMYRQSLSDEQTSTLPAHPAGELELSNAELESVHGDGGFGPGGFGPGGFGPIGFGPETSGASAASSGSFSQSTRFHSLAFRCNEAVFSLTFVHGFNVLSPVNAFCINDQD